MPKQKSENTKMLNLRFPPELVERVDALVGPYRRPTFIREATEKAVEMAELVARHERKND
jgi:predicted DNA-binding protein